MTTVSIGPKGFVKLQAVQSGPQRKIRAIAFTGRATLGDCPNCQFRKEERVVGVVDMTKGWNVSASFEGYTDTGNITLTDTGGLGADGDFGGHELIAFCLNDTGTIG